MIKKLRHALTIKYTLILTCLLFAGLTASFAAYRHTGFQLLQSGLKSYLAEEVQEMRHALKAGTFAEDIRTVKSSVKSMHNFTYVLIDGKIVRAERPFDEAAANQLERKLSSGKYKSGKIYREKVKGWRFLIAKQNLGNIEIFVAANYSPVHRNVRAYAQNALIAALIAIVLSYFAGGWFAAKSFDYIEQSYEKQKRFVSDAAHEFRTPLTILYSYAELLEYAPEKSEIIADIKDEIQQMSDMVDRLLAIARYDNSGAVAHFEHFSLTALAQSVIKPWAALYPSGTFELDGNGVEITADKTMIRQLLGILLDNAVKYTGEDKKISVSLAQKSNAVEIAVKDNGIGIERDNLPKIFDRFWRAEAARHEKGLGLGLSLAETIVNLHNGTIRADSTIGAGTTFTVVLPQNFR